MQTKNTIAVIVSIMLVLGLNAIATAIDNPEVYTKDLPEPVPVAQLETNNHIEKTAKRYGLNPNIIKALIEEESGWLSSAEGDNGESVGLMQIQERWHKDRMKRLGVTNLYDSEQNITVGCDILSELLNKYGNYRDALSAYNSGNTKDGRAYAERILNAAK
ncbi:MAG: lytic transglycosylase domain-containing protein [[Eubacterium] sulci]|nr:lytic transglycosylase domain-containing protein [[Eubacterium] sulci]